METSPTCFECTQPYDIAEGGACIHCDATCCEDCLPDHVENCEAEGENRQAEEAERRRVS